MQISFWTFKTVLFFVNKKKARHKRRAFKEFFIDVLSVFFSQNRKVFACQYLFDIKQYFYRIAEFAYTEYEFGIDRWPKVRRILNTAAVDTALVAVSHERTDGRSVVIAIERTAVDKSKMKIIIREEREHSLFSSPSEPKCYEP